MDFPTRSAGLDCSLSERSNQVFARAHEGIYEWKYAKEQKEETIATHDGPRNTAFTINRPSRCPHVCSGALCLPCADAEVDRIVAAPLAQN